MYQNELAIEIRNVTKYFDGICALNNVNLVVKKGSIHSLLGENGAGKSTLMKILCGIVDMDNGMILLNKEFVSIKSYAQAQQRKLAFVPQELAIVNYFSVAENIFLGREPVNKLGLVDKGKLYKQAAELLNNLKINLDPYMQAGNLSISEMQMMIIAKALSLDAEIIILDEPTARLGGAEIDNLLYYLKYLQSIGKTIIYITHKLEEVFKICDEVTVLRDGHVVGTHFVNDITMDELIYEMVNRPSEKLAIVRKSNVQNEIVLSAEHIKCENQVKDVNFELHKGEILGIYGLIGAGRTETIRAMLGIDKMKNGKVFYKGKEVHFKNIRESMNSGIVLIPEERRLQGLILSLPIYQNMSITKLKQKYSHWGFILKKKERKDAKVLKDELHISCARLDNPAGSLSGGNQQKVVLSKFIDMTVDIFIFDEPTRGIDVGSKSEIYSLINKISENEKSIIIISSEIPELQSVCDRVLIMKSGVIVKSLLPDEFCNAETIMKYSVGEL